MIKKIKKNQEGFTLIELLTVIAIIAILSSALMVSLGVYKKRANANKVLLELSSAMQKVYLCISDGFTAVAPSSGGNICQDTSGDGLVKYGQWPVLESGYSYGSSKPFSGSWAYWASSGTDDVMICCNSTYNKCNKLDKADSSCDANTVLK